MKSNFGRWGGYCTCPNGSVYPVADEKNSCESLACIGGKNEGCMKEASDAWKFMGVVSDKFKVALGDEATEESIETSADPQKGFSLAKYKLGAVIPFKISKIIEKAKGLWYKDQFHDEAIFLNIKSFSKNLAANLLAHKPEHLRPKYEKIIPTLQKLDFEDFATHVMINFPDREETYSDGNWENIARYFYPRSS
jgi:hypothetical protein